MGVQTIMAVREETLTPQDIAEGYMRSYHALHGRQPRVRHMGGLWYEVNGEIVHRSTLLNQMNHLRSMTHKRRMPEKSLIMRVISRVRGL